MSRQPRIAVVGSANVDLTTYAETFPRPGETVFAGGFELGWGGKGANQAVAARLCGAEVCMVAAVGDDLFGRATIDNLQSHGLDVSHVKTVSGVSSGVAPIFVEAGGQNRIFVIKGANDHLLPADVDRAAPLLERADCIILQFEIPLATVYHAVRFARQRGIRCLVNPAPALPADLAALASVEYLVPNESEAEAITGIPIHSVGDAQSNARALVDRGFGRVVLTLGERGAVVADRAGAELVPPFPVPVQDTTGAGDAFVGSFAVFLCEGSSEHEAAARANLYAALSTTSRGTQKSFVTRTRFDETWETRGRPIA